VEVDAAREDPVVRLHADRGADPLHPVQERKVVPGEAHGYGCDGIGP
jgi:hypothetical protein